jgi:murein DD-endopeptidase MepM/ murein hydrolase activator NlpD
MRKRYLLIGIFLFLPALSFSQSTQQGGSASAPSQYEMDFEEFKGNYNEKFAEFKAKRDSAYAAFLKKNWAEYARTPGVSLPASPDNINIKTVDIPAMKEDENPNVEIIEVLLKEGVSETHAANIAVEIIDSLGIDAIKDGQSISIATEQNNSEKPVIVSYNVNPSEKTILLQTNTDEYKVIEEKEAPKKSYNTYRSSVDAGDDLPKSINKIKDFNSQLSGEAVSIINNLVAGNVTTGDKFWILVRKDVIDAQNISEKILAVGYESQKTDSKKETFLFQDGKGSPFNGFYTSNGSSIVTSQFLFPLRSSYRRTDRFGMRSHPILKKPKAHNGTDYGAPKGTDIYAIADGTVTESNFDSWKGHYVIIRHANGIESHYYHMNERGITKGSNVAPGQKIGRVGNTGRSTGPHLHLGVKKNGGWYDPEKILGTMVATAQLVGDKQKKFNEQVAELRKLI